MPELLRRNQVSSLHEANPLHHRANALFIPHFPCGSGLLASAPAGELKRQSIRELDRSNRQFMIVSEYRVTFLTARVQCNERRAGAQASEPLPQGEWG
jgi:hypothetical protein